MILNTKQDFENAILKGEKIKTKTIFYTGELEEQPNTLEIGTYDRSKGVYCGELNGKQIWCDLHDAPEQLTWKQAVKYAKEKGGQLPSIDELTVAYLHKDEINAALEANGGEPFKKDDYYWSSSEYSNNLSWALYMDSGYRLNYNKYHGYYVRVFQLV